MPPDTGETTDALNPTGASLDERTSGPIRDLTRLKHKDLSMRLPDGPAGQFQRTSRWYAQRLDGTLLDCGLDDAGYKQAIAMLKVWEANGQ